MPTSAPTSPQLAVYAKLLCLLMVVVCGAAVPMEENVRLFNEKTKGFMEASRRGPFVSARNVDVNLSKYTNLTIRSTGEFGVVELVFADLRPQRRLCMDKDGKLKGVKKLTGWRPGCLFRECIDGGYFFYLTSHARPRLLGFNRGEQLNPPGPARCCSLERRLECGPAGCWEDGEHLVRDRRGRYTCARQPARQDEVDYFFFLKKRQENATIADTIPVHNHRQGGHNASPAEEEQPRRPGRPHRSRGHPAAAATTAAPRLQRQRPHRTRHHHRLQTQLQPLPARTPRPVRVRHRKAHHAPHEPGNHLPWD